MLDEAKDAPPFGVNEMRLNARQWLAALAIFLACAVAMPRIWKRVERFDTGQRLPHPLRAEQRLLALPAASGADLGSSERAGAGRLGGLGRIRAAGRHADAFSEPGERPAGPLRQLRRQRRLPAGDGGADRALRRGAAQPQGHRPLQRAVDEQPEGRPERERGGDFQPLAAGAAVVHARFPVTGPMPPTRLNVVAERSIGLLGWVNIWTASTIDQLSIPRWTLEEDGSDPPRCPNAWRNPLAQITLTVPGEPARRPAARPRQPAAQALERRRQRADALRLGQPGQSLQWQAFQRSIGLLRSRGNDVLVILGPFNESMVAEDQRPALHRMRDGIAAWLTSHQIPHIVPDALPSDLYADASHPLTEGYALLARRIWAVRLPDLARKALTLGPRAKPQRTQRKANTGLAQGAQSHKEMQSALKYCREDKKLREYCTAERNAAVPLLLIERHNAVPARRYAVLQKPETAGEVQLCRAVLRVLSDCFGKEGSSRLEIAGHPSLKRLFVTA